MTTLNDNAQSSLEQVAIPRIHQSGKRVFKRFGGPPWGKINKLLPAFLLVVLAAQVIYVPPLQASAASVVLVGAGDISSCNNNNDEATAKLLDGISGTVFNAGDNAYDSGTISEYTNCYDPTWGRH